MHRMTTSHYRKTSMFPRTLAQCIEPAVRPVLKSQGLAGSRILTEWPAIVGKKLAAYSVPEKLSFPPGKKTGGTLTIAVENGFAPEIQHQQPIIMQRLATYFGYQAIARISISHTYLPIQASNAKLPAKKGALPKAIGSYADEIKDDELRATLQSFAKTLCETST